MAFPSRTSRSTMFRQTPRLTQQSHHLYLYQCRSGKGYGRLTWSSGVKSPLESVPAGLGVRAVPWEGSGVEALPGDQAEHPFIQNERMMLASMRPNSLRNEVIIPP